MRFSNILPLLPLLPLAVASPVAQRSEPAPLLVPRGISSKHLIPESYIVKFKDGSSSAALHDAMKLIPEGIRHQFDSPFQGFAGKFDAAALEKIRGHPHVEYVEQDAISKATAVVTQHNAPWGLSRISHEQSGSSDYVYDSSAGEGVCAYIVDSGLDDSHPDFEGRAQEVKSFNGGSGDTCGHGTHVAGTIGSKTYGVAKKAKLYGVRVLAHDGNDCTGANSGIIAGLQYVAKDSARRSCPKGVVVNMSLGGGYSKSENDAVASLVRQGIFVAVAAGNGDSNHNPIDASQVSPASEPSACTIGASDRFDNIASFSNYGSVVDLHGPGVDIISTRVGGGTTSMDGTSMATPHVVGLAAYFMGRGKSANGLCGYLGSIALENQISGVHSGTKNLLIQNDQSQ